jgi:glycosyltransferase involved in cell wall biosynthesis
MTDGDSPPASVVRPLVAVSTPVYNTRQHLAECIDSVLQQTYDHWEYVIQDNCSTDGSLELAREYERRDPRIRVVAATEFLDQVENQNRALRQISPDAKYCKIVHADDWLFPECLERMVALAEANPTVGIVGAYRLEGNQVSLDGLPYWISVLPGRDACRAHLASQKTYGYLFGSPTSLLFRADLIRAREPFFNPANPFQDDQEACLDVLGESDFGFVHQVLTYTRRHDQAGFTYAGRLGVEQPGHLDLLVRYGPVYLTESEYELALAVRLARYGLFLVRNLGKLADGDFRTYQWRSITGLRRSVRADQALRGVPRAVGRILRRRRLRGA